MTGQAPEAQYQSYNPQQYANAPMGQQIPPAGVQHNQSYDLPPLPPRQSAIMDPADDPSHPVHYTRDPHRLVAYLVPFPRPQVKGAAPDSVPMRFLIYTPPPPPLTAPKEGEKEDKFHKIQRKWQEEVKTAKTSDAKTMSWKGVKGKATRGINTAMSWTTTSNLDFINRLGSTGKDDQHDKHAEDGHHEENETHKTVGLEAMTLVYPPSMNMTPEQLRQEFVNTMMRSKTKAQKDAIIATGLLPVSACIDICATLIWPFGGLLEIDGVWAVASIRGAKTSRSVTKRLTSSSKTGKHDEDQLRLEFVPSPRLETLDKYLGARCHERDPKLFHSPGVPPTETEVLEAIGWAPSQTGGEQKNWEDEQWETVEVKDDIKSTMGKGAREWDKWVKAFEKNPEKALKK